MCWVNAATLRILRSRVKSQLHATLVLVYTLADLSGELYEANTVSPLPDGPQKPWPNVEDIITFCIE